MSQNTPQNRRSHAIRCAYAVGRDLSSAIGELSEMGRLFHPEFHTLALEIEKIQRRVNDAAEGVQ